MPFHQGGLTRLQGDPGFFGSIGKILGGVARALPGPIGFAARAFTSGGTSRTTGRVPAPRGTGTSRTGTGRAVTVRPDGTVCPTKKRRRIDPLNMKALRRANTRQRAFLRAVDSTLKSMPTKGQVTRRRQKIRGAK